MVGQQFCVCGEKILREFYPGDLDMDYGWVTDLGIEAKK